jgi:hypothetical protein
LLGPKCSYLHPYRLTGQIDGTLWISISGISPLCLQIYFCINTSFGTLGGTDLVNMLNPEIDAGNIIAVTEEDLKEDQK